MTTDRFAMSDVSNGFSKLDLAREDWSLAAVFGAASVPWTYAFVAGGLPLWPSFVAAASFYAAGEDLRRSYLANALGIGYAAVTIGIVGWLSAVAGVAGGTVELVLLSLLVGVGMFVASFHGALGLFNPGGFFGYAAMFGVHAAGAVFPGTTGLAGETLATLVAMLLGAAIGLATARLRDRLAG